MLCSLHLCGVVKSFFAFPFVSAANPALPLLHFAGIENDIKIWSPTAEEVQGIPHEAHEVMQENMRGQGQVFSRQTMLTPAALRRLLRYRNNPDPVER